MADKALHTGASAYREIAPLHIYKTIGSSAGPLDFIIAALVHTAVWGGGMVLGPLSVLCAPLGFFILPTSAATAVLATVMALCLMPPLPEWPAFCRLYLRSTSLLKGGATLWVADEVIPHVSEGAMICYHPHGVIPLGFTFNGAIRAKTRDPAYMHEKVTISHRVSGVQAPVLFKIPIMRQVLQLFGCTMPATKAGMFKLFKERMTFGIVVGGSEEVAVHIGGRERLFLANRAGFLKYAMQFGYKVVVAYNFGESDLYQNLSGMRSLNMWLVKRFGFVLPIFWGRWWCPILPRGDIELNTVFGEMLQLPKIEDPSPEDVATWHENYKAAVERVFETHKHRFGYGDRKIEIL